MRGAVEGDGFFEAAFADVAPLMGDMVRLGRSSSGEGRKGEWKGLTGQTVSETILMLMVVMMDVEMSCLWWLCGSGLVSGCQSAG